MAQGYNGMKKKNEQVIPNKKIKNASVNKFNDIEFKSKLESICYKVLLDAGFHPEYEKKKFIIWQGFRPTVLFYNKDNTTRELKLDNKKLMDITYTPDFTFYYNGILIIIEIKGFQNDLYPMKRKIFRGWLEKQSFQSVFFEIHTKGHMLQAVDIIKNLAP